jgi:FkbM family methyltransferase
MKLNLELKNKYNLKIEGIILIGAHYGNEYDELISTGAKNIIMFEPLKNNFEVLSNNIKDENVILVNKALGNENKKVIMFVESENKGMSSSVLEPKLHINYYPHIVFNETEEVDMIRLDDMNLDENKYNFILIDVQGYEMEVFKGAEKTLENIDYIITEINNVELYRNCVMFKNLTEYLNKFGFVVADDKEATNGSIWGDVLFKKNI